MASAKESIDALVSAAVRRHALSLGCESGLLGAAAAGVTYASALLSGAEATAPGNFLAASLSGVFCGVSWWFERRKSPEELVRRMDRTVLSAEGARAGLGDASLGEGGLITAVEVAARTQGNALEAALLERAARVDPTAARRAIAPPAVALLAAPLLAAAAVTLLLEPGLPGSKHPGGAGSSPELQRLSALVAQARSLGSGAGGALAGEDAELEALLKRALDELELDPERFERVLAQLDASLARRAESAVGGERSAWERARAEVRELRGDSNDRDTGELSGPGLAAGPTGDTMEGSPQVAQDAGDPAGALSAPQAPAGSAEAGSAEARGAAAVRFWDPQYDGVVSAWVLRAAAENSER